MSCDARPGSTLGASRKRKDREWSDALRIQVPHKAEPNSSAAAHAAPSSNRLLAGYLAHEFLTKGTLFGQRWEPVRSEPEKSVETVRPAARDEPNPAKPQRAYVEVSHLLKMEGVQVPGVVNPTQLARWLRM
ncbi:uncharacterized protein LOC103716259 [Phoenix dactylifera]|uniref:Uncharacterized protein LOC103716259 n=1 Tax=Phoenix dactylifera TaxID=42345 RepID=A0A8B8J9D4_PHODC|nr:uncharacterized protein LOC103716259 [Phoenix dactylifera]